MMATMMMMITARISMRSAAYSIHIRTTFPISLLEIRLNNMASVDELQAHSLFNHSAYAVVGRISISAT
jgi:hypothetical protein